MNNLEEPEITFVVPAYNTQHTISRTIDSILGQTDDRYRIIIVNDGSTDNTEKICEEYAKKYPQKINYVYQENRGLGGARNHGIQLTDTRYISFLDSDDWLMPEYVETVIRCIDKNYHNQPEIIMTMPQIYNENSKIVSSWYDKSIFEEIFTEDGQIVNPQNNMKMFRTDVNQCRKILNMDFVRKIHFEFRENIKWEDVHPHFYLMSQCQSCMGIGSVGFYYRKGSINQITASRGKDRLDLIAVYNDLFHLIETNDLSKPLSNQLKRCIVEIMISFAREGVRMADMDTRRELVTELNDFFKKIPLSWYKKVNADKKNAVRYRLFLIAIKHKFLSRWFYDYLYQAALENAVKKIIRVFKKKEEIHGTA